MTVVEPNTLRSQLQAEQERLVARLQEVQRALDGLCSNTPVVARHDQVMSLNKAETIAAGILDRQPNLFRKLAQ